MRIPDLHEQNRRYADTDGVSRNNRHRGFVPAFKDTETGQVALSRFGDGRTAPVHMLEGLPDEWVVERSSDGEVIAIVESVIAGFLLDGVFLTRQQAARQVAA